MSDTTAKVAAVMLVDPQIGPLGLPARHEAPLADTTVLGMTLRRLARSRSLDQIILVHPTGAAPNVPDDSAVQKRLAMHEVVGPLYDRWHPMRIAARKWAVTCWRGGLGGMTVYDELLSARLVREALDAHGATAAMLVAPDWPLLDPALCDAVIERHVDQSEGLRLVFTQAPPGFTGLVIDKSLLEELDEADGTIGSILDYNVRAPQGDPISKDLCVGIDPTLRNATLRATFDAPRWSRPIEQLASVFSADDMLTMDATTAASQLLDIRATHADLIPQQVVVELNTQRTADGPIVPQHHVDLSREPMSLDRARTLFEQLAAEPDVAVTLGGLGDALLHPKWREIVTAARNASVWGVHLETDLLVESDVLELISEAPVDVLSVRLNADTGATYERLMGVNALEQVTDHLQTLLRRRAADAASEAIDAPCLPWIAPRMIKTTDNVAELEAFFDRWTHFAGHAWVEPTTTGLDLIADRGVLDMAPPRRVACRQIEHRMSVLADGRAAMCDQDWQCRGTDEHVNGIDIAGAWQRLAAVRNAHRDGQFEQIPLCAGCREWHRP